jgi:hypothetical protein
MAPWDGGLADFEPELSTDEADGAVAASAVAELSATSSEPAEESSMTRPRPEATSSSRTDGGIKTSGTTRQRHGIGSLIAAAGVGAVVTAAGFAGYLLPPISPARAVQPAPPTEPAQRDPRDPTGDLPSENLTGWWTLTNEVHATSYRRYRGLRLVYRLRLQQDGNRINGNGQKWAENGRPIPRASRTPIEVSGTIEGRRLVLVFTERGLRRTSGGAFELTVLEDGRLSGTFQSDAAQSKGSSVAQRGDGPQEG